jgi:hypothetical protein
MLHLHGEQDGKPVVRSWEVGDLPWFQTLSVSLAHFLSPGAECGEFWILRPDTLELQRLKVAAVRKEQISFNGGTVATWCVEIRPTGLFSALWKGEYWFRQSDRRFLRYRGASGPPGAPMTEILLVGEG